MLHKKFEVLFVQLEVYSLVLQYHASMKNHRRHEQNGETQLQSRTMPRVTIACMNVGWEKNQSESHDPSLHSSIWFQAPFMRMNPTLGIHRVNSCRFHYIYVLATPSSVVKSSVNCQTFQNFQSKSPRTTSVCPSSHRDLADHTSASSKQTYK